MQTSSYGGKRWSLGMFLLLAGWLGCDSRPDVQSALPKSALPKSANATQIVASETGLSEGKDSQAVSNEAKLETSLPTPSTAKSNNEPKAKREAIYIEEPNGKQLIADALARAKREHKNVLIEWGGNWCGWCYKLYDVFHQDSSVRPIVFEEYELVLIDERKNYDLMLEYGGRDRKYSFPHLTVLDAEGNILTNQETGSLEEGPRHKPELVVGFLKQWMPKRLDAHALFEDAIAIAKRDNKNVMMRVGDPYCGWCKFLSQFISDQQTILDKDYVSLKIDTLRMDHGLELANQYKPKGCEGVPWFIILDSKGETLVSSMSSKGNIGCPSEPHEIEYFGEILRKTKNRLSNDEIDSLLTDLNERREKRQQKQ